MPFALDPTLARVATALGWALLHALWQGALVAFVLSGLLALLHRASSELRYALCVGALAVAALLPLATFAVLYLDAAPPAVGGSGLALTSSDIATLTAALEAAAGPGAGTAGPTEVVAIPWRVLALILLRQALPWLVLVWGMGALIMAARLGGGWLYARRLTRVGVEPVDDEWGIRLEVLAERMGIRRPVELLASARVEAPVVIGWLRPVILFPVGFFAGMPVAHVEAVLMHELAHVRRHDYLVSVLQGVVEAAFYYSPAVWWLSRQVREAREACCDDAAVAASGDAFGYAKALAALEGLRQEHRTLALGAGGAGLRGRIERILGLSPQAPSAAPVVLAVLGLACTLLLGARFFPHDAISETTEAVSERAAIEQRVAEAGRAARLEWTRGAFVGMMHKDGWTLNMNPRLAPRDTVAWTHVAFDDRTRGNPPVRVFQIGITEHELSRIDSLQAALTAAVERGDERSIAMELHKVRLAQQVARQRRLDTWAASMGHALHSPYEAGGDAARIQVIEALAGGGPAALNQIKQAIRTDPSPRVRAAAVSTLAGEADVHLELLQRVAIEDAAAEVRQRATKGLLISGSSSASSALQSIYEQSPHADTRSLAVIGLGTRGPRLAPFLSTILERDPAFAADALTALGGTHSAEAVAPIVRFIERTADPALQEAARKALQTLALYDIAGAAEALAAL